MARPEAAPQVSRRPRPSPPAPALRSKRKRAPTRSRSRRRACPGAGDRKGSALYVALADSGLVSDVKAGENAGVRLEHDHVVRALRGGFAVDGNGDAAANVALPWPSEAGKVSTVVAFVQNTETGAVLQTLPLPVSTGACPRPR